MQTRRWFVILAAGLGLTLVTGDARAAERKTWRFDKGFIENTKGNEWFERVGDDKYRFVEVKRTDDFIELHDESRKLSLRLYKDHSEIKSPKTDQKWEEFRKGKWDK